MFPDISRTALLGVSACQRCSSAPCCLPADLSCRGCAGCAETGRRGGGGGQHVAVPSPPFDTWGLLGDENDFPGKIECHGFVFLLTPDIMLVQDPALEGAGGGRDDTGDQSRGGR